MRLSLCGTVGKDERNVPEDTDGLASVAEEADLLLNLDETFEDLGDEDGQALVQAELLVQEEDEREHRRNYRHAHCWNLAPTSRQPPNNNNPQQTQNTHRRLLDSHRNPHRRPHKPFPPIHLARPPPVQALKPLRAPPPLHRVRHPARHFDRDGLAARMTLRTEVHVDVVRERGRSGGGRGSTEGDERAERVGEDGRGEGLEGGEAGAGLLRQGHGRAALSR